jgi:hypothetical protein
MTRFKFRLRYSFNLGIQLARKTYHHFQDPLKGSNHVFSLSVWMILHGVRMHSLRHDHFVRVVFINTWSYLWEIFDSKDSIWHWLFLRISYIWESHSMTPVCVRYLRNHYINLGSYSLNFVHRNFRRNHPSVFENAWKHLQHSIWFDFDWSTMGSLGDCLATTYDYILPFITIPIESYIE